MKPLRIGVLGAARIAELAIVKPAHATGTRLVAIAARDPDRAAAFAAAHGVERVTNSYTELLADPTRRTRTLSFANVPAPCERPGAVGEGVLLHLARIPDTPATLIPLRLPWRRVR